jgi:hypothetical protein
MNWIGGGIAIPKSAPGESSTHVSHSNSGGAGDVPGYIMNATRAFRLSPGTTVFCFSHFSIMEADLCDVIQVPVCVFFIRGSVRANFFPRFSVHSYDTHSPSYLFLSYSITATMRLICGRP